MTSKDWSLFALTRNPKQPVIRLPMSKDLQEAVTSLFDEQHAEFLGAGDLEEVEFDVRLTPDESEIFLIRDFELPTEIVKALQDPLSVEAPAINEEVLQSIRGIFLGHSSTPEARFQVFDARRALSARGFSLVLSAGVLRRLDQPGLTLDRHLAASYLDQTLYFRSYYQARRLLDLSAYFQEATQEQLDEFSRHGALHADPQKLNENADSWVRKRVALILEGGILDKKPTKDIVQIAENYGLELQVVRKAGKDRLALPEEKRELKDFLRFLEEDFFRGILTNTRFVSNSKRRLR